jgi:hypothetical protein
VSDPLPKTPREICQEFLAYIRQQRCCVRGMRSDDPCIGNTQADHLETRGAHGSDFYAIPLCAAHHTIRQAARSIAWFNERYNVDVWRIAAKHIKHFFCPSLSDMPEPI